MDSQTTRVYLQLRPDQAAVDGFGEIARNLPVSRSGRLLPPDELHVTVIHVGKAPDVLRALRGFVALPDTDFMYHLAEYVDRTQAILPPESYALTPRGYDRFGARGSTLVARYDAPDDLRAVHAAAYRELLRFFAACGIKDPEGFAAHDPNFRTAGTLTPHVTLYKGYDGALPTAPLPDMRVSWMKLVY